MAVCQHDAAAARCVLGGVEGVPAPADKRFKPGMLIHRLEPVQVAHHHARRNLQAAAQRNADVGKVAADACAVSQRVQRIGGRRADAIAIHQVFVNPGANFLRLRVARPGAADHRQGDALHLVRRAVTALQQVQQHVVGQLGNWRVGRIRRDGNVVVNFHRHLDGDAHRAFANRQALAQVTVAVDKFGAWHPRLQVVAFADDRLRLAATRAQHGDQRAVGGGGQAQGAGGFDLHGLENEGRSLLKLSLPVGLPTQSFDAVANRIHAVEAKQPTRAGFAFDLIWRGLQ